jgi:hypothetical protein
MLFRLIILMIISFLVCFVSLACRLWGFVAPGKTSAVLVAGPTSLTAHVQLPLRLQLTVLAAMQPISAWPRILATPSARCAPDLRKDVRTRNGQKQTRGAKQHHQTINIRTSMKMNSLTKTLTLLGLTALFALPARADGLGDLLGAVGGIVGQRNRQAGDVIKILGVATSFLEEGDCQTLSDGARVVDSRRYKGEVPVVRTVLDLFTPGWRDQSDDAQNLAFQEMAGFLNLPAGSATEKFSGHHHLFVERLAPGQVIVTVRSR